jgi:uncharacterized protein YjbJ (UPF0337 family)
MRLAADCIISESTRRILMTQASDEAVDHDRAEGSVKQLKGKIKQGAGTLLGDEKLKNEGRADQAEGKLQNAWGSAKDAVRDAVGKK